MRSLLVSVFAAAALIGTESAAFGEVLPCKPAFVELKEPLSISMGSWELTFNLLAIGCAEKLAPKWPPPLEKLKKQLESELREPHPVQTLFLIRDRSVDLRERVTRCLNNALGSKVVEDAFMFNAKASEY